MAIQWFRLFINWTALHKFIWVKLIKISLYNFLRWSCKMLVMQFFSRWKCNQIIKAHKIMSLMLGWLLGHRKNTFPGKIMNLWLTNRLKAWKKVIWWSFLIWKKAILKMMIRYSILKDQKSNHKTSLESITMIIVRKKQLERLAPRKSVN